MENVQAIAAARGKKGEKRGEKIEEKQVKRKKMWKKERKGKLKMIYDFQIYMVSFVSLYHSKKIFKHRIRGV